MGALTNKIKESNGETETNIDPKYVKELEKELEDVKRVLEKVNRRRR